MTDSLSHLPREVFRAADFAFVEGFRAPAGAPVVGRAPCGRAAFFGRPCDALRAPAPGRLAPLPVPFPDVTWLLTPFVGFMVSTTTHGGRALLLQQFNSFAFTSPLRWRPKSLCSAAWKREIVAFNRENRADRKRSQIYKIGGSAELI